MIVARSVASGAALGERIESADGFLGRFLGLMGRPPLAPGEGLWLAPCSSIHMLAMRGPIDAVWLGPERGGRRRVLRLDRALPAWRGVVPFVRGAAGVLELAPGAIDAAQVRVGDEVRLEGGGDRAAPGEYAPS